MKKHIILAAIIAVLAIIIVAVVVTMNSNEPTPAPSEAGQAGTKAATGVTEDRSGERPSTTPSGPSETQSNPAKEEDAEPETEHIPEEPITGKEYNVYDFTIVRDENGKDWITAYNGSEKEIRISASKFGLLKPSAIGPGAFAGKDIEYFLFRGEITEIGERAFENCKKLRYFEVGIEKETLTRIGYRAFAGTESLKEFIVSMDTVIPKNIVFIEPEIFQGSGIEKIQIGGAYQIKDRAFADCPFLRELWIPADTMVFANNMIENSPGVIIYCPNYSKAMEWCKEHVVMAMDSGKTRGQK